MPKKGTPVTVEDILTAANRWQNEGKPLDFIDFANEVAKAAKETDEDKNAE